MGCENCASRAVKGTPMGCKNNGTCATGGCNKLNVFDWLSNMDLPSGQKPFDIVEVRFKNSRKAFYRNVNDLTVQAGELLTVEGSPGFDVGVVSVAGELARIQFNKKSTEKPHELKKILRKATENDIETWKKARGLEEETMYEARTLALKHALEMKISDVEYQGDKSKATFYYTADGRVDFRQLIKSMAEKFKIRIEMRQIGARQESARLGGIGSCGRELCCSTWLSDFRSVSTSAARYQQLSLNPQKLAGQCGKLKCCLNYELDMYVEAFKDIPSSNTSLKTRKGIAFHQKTDLFKRMMWYSYADEQGGSFIPIPVDRVKEIIELNKSGKKPEDLKDFALHEEPVVEEDYGNVVGQDSLTRFDKSFSKKKKPNKRNKNFKGKRRNKSNQNKKS